MMRRLLSRGALRGGLGVVVLVVCLGAPGVSQASMAWSVRGAAEPGEFVPGAGGNDYELEVHSAGSEPSTSGITLTDRLPQGLTMARFVSGVESQEEEIGWGCEEREASVVTCSFEGVVPAGGYAPSLMIEVAPPDESRVPLENSVSVSGGGASVTATTSESAVVGTAAQLFGITEFALEARTASGDPVVQAGGHPWQVTASLEFPSTTAPPSNATGKRVTAVENAKSISVELPVGMVGDPLSAERCTQVELRAERCPPGSEVGTFAVTTGLLEEGGFVFTRDSQGGASAVYNMVPEPGYPADLAFEYAAQDLHLYATVVHSAAGERVRLTTVGIPTILETLGAVLTIWGEPGQTPSNGSGSTAAFLTAPADCQGPPQNAHVEVNSWSNPARVLSEETRVFGPLSGCEALQFQPTIAVAPRAADEGGSTQADEPSGYAVDLRIPQTSDFSEAATPQPEDLTVAFPAGVSLSPSAAQGLRGCQERGPEGINLGSEQIGPAGKDEGDPEATELGAGYAGGNGSPFDDGQYHTARGHCPEASTIGSVEVFTPLLATRCGGQVHAVGEEQAACKPGESPAPLSGHVYLAAPKCGGAGQPACTTASATNGELFGAYLEVEGTGVIAKLPGTVSADPATGQVTASFKNLPQLPYNEVKLHLKGGPGAPLANPQTCGPQTTTADLTPWSTPQTPDATPTSSFDVDWDGQGGACPATLPFAPSFLAQTQNPAAGAFSPFVLSFSRQDREQDLSGVRVTLPTGLLAKVAGVALCEEAQANAGTCGQESQIGTTSALAGAGEDPLYISGGRVYLTQGYKGQPFGLSIVVPAVAGPFNLGDVVVRAAIHIDPKTAQVTVTSDPLPQIVDGVPLRLRAVNVEIDRPGGFTLNPTNCAAQSVQGTIAAAQGATAGVSSRFAVTGCDGLAFAPQFKVTASGHPSRSDGESFTAQILYPTASAGGNYAAGQANVRSVKVELPKQLPARLGTLQKACVAAVFDANPASCPAASVVGRAVVHTPLLGVPLEGPAYFVSHGGAGFPDLTLVLQGEGVTVELVGSTFIKNGITSSTFKSVPDVPLASFELTLPEGPYSALSANGNPCAQKLSMPTEFVAQNGREIHESTPIVATGCAPALEVLAHSSRGRTAKIVVGVPSAGRLRATGPRLSSATRKPGKAGRVTVALTLSRHAQAFVLRHPGRMMRVRVKLVFTPLQGATLTKYVTVLVG